MLQEWEGCSCSEIYVGSRAILAVNVAGYSRLMAADESGMLAALKSLREELINPQTAKHAGRIVKLMGDGALVEFPSAVDAVACAVEIQSGTAERNGAVSEDRRIRLRIGIDIGDIIIDVDDIYGDGVNIAARLEGFALRSCDRSTGPQRLSSK